MRKIYYRFCGPDKEIQRKAGVNKCYVGQKFRCNIFAQVPITRNSTYIFLFAISISCAFLQFLRWPCRGTVISEYTTYYRESCLILLSQNEKGQQICAKFSIWKRNRFHLTHPLRKFDSREKVWSVKSITISKLNWYSVKLIFTT